MAGAKDLYHVKAQGKRQKGNAASLVPCIAVAVSDHYDRRMNPTSEHPVFALICPVCGGQVEKVGERQTRSLYACKECECDVIVPLSAWEIARVKRQQKWPPKRTSVNPFSRLVEMRSVASGRGSRG